MKTYVQFMFMKCFAILQTYIGRVLISVNPFKLLRIYGEDAINFYRNDRQGAEHAQSGDHDIDEVIIPSKKDRSSRCSTAQIVALEFGKDSEAGGAFEHYKVLYCAALSLSSLYCSPNYKSIINSINILGILLLLIMCCGLSDRLG